MKEWIKQHPWRLEVVPSLILLSAVILPLAGRYATAHGEPWSRYVEAEHTWFGYIATLLAVVIIWLKGLRANHTWVQFEEKKKFNVDTVLRLPVMFLVTRTLFSNLFSPGVLVYWWIFASLCIVAQILLEATRRYVPLENGYTVNVASGEVEVHPGEPFYYREEVRDRRKPIKLAGLVALVTVFLLYSLKTGDDSWFWLSVLLLVLFVTLNSNSVFIVTNEKIFSKVDQSKLTIRMTDVKKCELFDYTPQKVATTRRVDRYIPDGKYGTFLWITTRNNRMYLLGMNNPETACKLIQTALAASAPGGI